MPGDRVDPEPSPRVESDDAELVRETLAGRKSAFDTLIERYQRRATSVSYRLLGNTHDALEVCQEAFIRAFKNLETLEDHNRFGPWLLRIVTNLSLNFRRSRGPRLSFQDCLLGSDESGEERIADADYSEDRPGAKLAATELQAKIQTALATLPPQQRTALVLFSIEQMPQKEVAEILNCSIEAVKWHVFQARRKLKEQLAEYMTE
jgi:RNA polymerase sigma-70 factor, ECF subfamily